ncbi:COMM domain-containing protein 6 isoform X1 [Notamacropus eugenii]|uniref:COMM domain-containing protein 6 isoform X1 n=1 Tax=Notamacropus eugenii TaxID=9315 RepID=UPI003B680AD5
MAAACRSAVALSMEGLCQPQQEAKSEVTNQLLDLQWKVGMAVSSDSCRSLKSPYVAMTLKVADQSGQITNKSFEMTIPQFQYFFKQFKEMAAVMETV